MKKLIACGATILVMAMAGAGAVLAQDHQGRRGHDDERGRQGDRSHDRRHGARDHGRRGHDEERDHHGKRGHHEEFGVVLGVV